MRLLEHAAVPLAGRHAVIVGRSTIVGKPMALLLLQKDATVTICHSKTADLAAITRQADILVAAVGKARMITAPMVKPGACVIDVGINRLADGKLAATWISRRVKEVAGRDHARARRRRTDDGRDADGQYGSCSGAVHLITENTNPLLDFSGLPRFAEIKPEHVGPAIDQLLAEARAAMQRADAAPATWDEFVTPLEDANERLGRAWGQVAHLHAVLDSPPLREAYNANLPKITQYWTELGQNQRCFEQVQGACRLARVRAACPGAQEARWRTRCAISGSAAPSCPRR